MYFYQIHTIIFTHNWSYKKSVVWKVEIKLKTWKICGFLYQQNSKLLLCLYFNSNNFLNLTLCVKQTISPIPSNSKTTLGKFSSLQK